MKIWGTHVYRIGNEENLDVQDPDDSKSIELQKKHIEPWLAAIFQSEYLALLLGSGFTKAVAYQAGTSVADMACDYGGFPLDDKLKEAAQQAAVAMGRGESFYNVSPFTLRDLKNRAKQQQLKADFEAYLDGFSPNVQEILDKFKFRNQIPTLIEADILGHLIEKFLDGRVNLSPKPVQDVDGNELLPALDNYSMGTIFEELIRRFNEENNEEAGEHFTPRDVVKLMADLIFLPVADDIESGTYLVYDGACGTGGMLTVAEERLAELAQSHGKDVSIHLFGQEVQPETYAISKADLLLKGEGAEAENMKYGSTLSNPPYGKSWKTDLEHLGGKGDIKDPRFVTQHGGDPEYKMITRSSDGQLMFLINKLSKMKHTTCLGSRIAEVHNGSSLFTGDAGQGESNIRRWIIENDWLEAIIALPENMFYNTGIATYIWVLTNRKSDKRRGKVQLIDATEWYVPLRRNLGKKNCEFSEEHIRAICDLVVNPVETEKSKIFPNEVFGYWKVMVDRPLRLAVDLSPARLERFERAIQYFHAFRDYLKERKSPYAPIVAFSGEHEYGGKKVAETTLNGFPSSQIPDKVQQDPYRFLIVADKFQTGYDEPLPHTMYVDKALSGIKAVQTLSRLNRAHPQKHDTFVLDFYNDSETIQKSFEPYYRTTILSDETDPNKLHDLKSDLDGYQVYSQAQIDDLVGLYLNGADRDKLDPILDACVATYNADLDEDGQVDFKGKAKAFVRTYCFLSSILPYSNADWEKLSVFLNFTYQQQAKQPATEAIHGR